MIFWCYPPSAKCEWANLRNFVDHYNSLYGKFYKHSRCLDVENRKEKEPELLLEAPGEIPIVVERKSVVWPSWYFDDHSNEHYLYNRILELLDNSFQDTVYQLTIGKASLKGKKKKEVNKLAEQIVRAILAKNDRAKSRRGIYSREPIPWSFCPLSLQERDESIPEKDVGLIIVVDTPTEPAEILRIYEATKLGFAREFENTVEVAVKKFEKYKDFLKLLVVQFHGDGSFILEEDIINIIKSTRLPDLIDQIWVAQPDWVTQNDYEVIWERVR